MMIKNLIRCSHLRETGHRAPVEVCAAVLTVHQITATQTAVKLWFSSAGILIQPQGKGEVAPRRFIPPLIPRDRYHL